MKTLSREGIQRMIDGQGASSGGGGGIQSLAGYATQAWTEENYLSKPYFNQLFTVHTQTTTTVVDDQGEPVGDPVVTNGTLAPNALPGTTETTDEETGYVTTVATVITSIEAKFGFWSQSFISALGQGSGGGGGGASALTDLVDVAISSVENGQVLMYDSTLNKWVNGTVQGGATALTALTDVAISSVENGQVLMYDSTLSKWVNGSVNAASATKLATARTLWGQSFDGTANVSGNMDGVGYLKANDYIAVTKSTASDCSVSVKNSNGSVGILTATNRGLYDMTSSNWIVGTNGNNSFLLVGNVGIGTTSPAYKLDVNGYAKATRLYLSDTIYLTVDNNGVHVVGGGLYADTYVSALGQGSGGGGGGASALTDLVDVAISSVQNGQVLMYDSALSKWVNGTVQSGGGGTVTSITAGTGLSGGTITSSGTIAISETYQNYITHGESAYNSLSNYLPLTGGTVGYLNATADITTLQAVNARSIELSFTTPYIDFHHSNSSADFTSRLITTDYGVLALQSKTSEDAGKMSGFVVGANYDGSYTQIGNIRIIYDSTNNALKIQKADGAAANIYATGSVSALGFSSGGGGGGDYIPITEKGAVNGVATLDLNGKVPANQLPIDTLESEINNKPATTGTTGDYPYNGMGLVTLPKNMVNGVNTLTQSMMPTSTGGNNVYVIKYDYDMAGNTIQVPSNCILKFEGGSLKNGTLTGQNTTIDADAVKIFESNLTLAGTWNVEEGFVEWYGCYANSSTKDTTPAIKKLVAVGIPIRFGEGTWYLSECLLSGLKKKVNIKGTSSHYRVGTTFKAFNASGQRFIMKLGGYADFSSPANDPNFTPGINDDSVHTNAYKSVWCSNFVLDGINFDTNHTAFVNADGTGECQNYAAVCFDWCVEGYVDIRSQGMCPHVFIANTWEVYFECITCYGCYTGLNGSAVYFGKCYTDVVYSNVSAVTIDNLFAESIIGKLVDCHNHANIADLVINNVEFEPYHSGQQTVSHDGLSAYQIIESNIRSMDVLYYFNFSGHHVIINSIAYCGNDDVTYENDTIARGIIKATTYGSHLLVGKIYCVTDNPTSIILGAANYAKLEVGCIECETYTANKQVYTVSNAVTSFVDIYDYPNGKNPANAGNIIIRESNVIVDKDHIRLYNPGLLFNSENMSEVNNFKAINHKTYLVTGYIDGIYVPLIYFFSVELLRKFRFNGTKLVFRYIGTNRWINGLSDPTQRYHIKMTYYKDGSVVQTDRVLLTYSATNLQNEEYTIWTGSYDYCTIYFNSAMCIESVTVKE